MSYRFCLVVFTLLNFSSFHSYSQIKHVVLIGVDGMGSYGIKKSNTPVMDSIMCYGSYTLQAKAVYPTLSSPNWASMILGVSPRDHAIRSNKWEKKGKRIDTERFPTIFKVIRQCYPHSHIALFYDWEEFGKFVEPGIPTVSMHTKGEDATTQKAIEYISDHKPLFTFIHLDNVDKAGHKYGHRSCKYTEAISKADSLIGEIIKAVHNAGMGDHTVIIITSDHGFKGKGHGGWRKKLKEIPWLVVGAGIQKGEKINGRVKIYDTAAMISFFLGIEIPHYWRGKTIKQVLVEE